MKFFLTVILLSTFFFGCQKQELNDSSSVEALLNSYNIKYVKSAPNNNVRVLTLDELKYHLEKRKLTLNKENHIPLNNLKLLPISELIASGVWHYKISFEFGGDPHTQEFTGSGGNGVIGNSRTISSPYLHIGQSGFSSTFSLSSYYRTSNAIWVNGTYSWSISVFGVGPFTFSEYRAYRYNLNSSGHVTSVTVYITD